MAIPAPAVAAAPKAPTTPVAPPAPASRDITVHVTDPALIAEIDAWEDGSAYTFNVTQNSVGDFNATEAYAAEVEEEAPTDEEDGEALQMANPVDKVIKAGAKKTPVA